MLKTKSEAMKVLGRTYRDKITLLVKKKIPDGQGGFKPEDYAPVASVGANIKRPRLETKDEAGAVASIMIHEIKIPNRAGVPDVRKGWRVKFGTKTFDVEHVYDDDYDQTKVLVCREVVK